MVTLKTLCESYKRNEGAKMTSFYPFLSGGPND